MNPIARLLSDLLDRLGDCVDVKLARLTDLNDEDDQ